MSSIRVGVTLPLSMPLYKLQTVRLQHSALMSLRADFISSSKHIHAKSRRTVDIKIMRNFHFFFDPIFCKAFTSTNIKTA